MAGRRRQFGSIRQLPSGRWQARYRNSSGRLGPAPRTFATKGDASCWLAAAEVDQARGLWADPSAGTVSLETYAWEWLRSKTGISPRTREIYEHQLRVHVLPVLGEYRLAQLTPDLVRRWYAGLAEARGQSVAAKAYVRLRQILGQAVDDDRIPKNPCRLNGAGTERHPEQRFLTVEELYRLVEAVSPRYRALILTAGLGGLRQGELFALRRDDIDLSTATVTVRRKRLRLASGDAIEGPPKSATGVRTVAPPEPAVTVLRRHLGDHVGSEGDAYVFTTPDGRPLERSNFRYRVWLPALERAGLEGLRFHDLRHTAGTLGAQTGATTKELLARLGHARPRASLIYQHAAADRDRRIAERLTDMIAEAGSRGPSLDHEPNHRAEDR